MYLCQSFSNPFFLSSLAYQFGDKIFPHLFDFELKNHIVVFCFFLFLLYWFNGIWVIVLGIFRSLLAFRLLSRLHIFAIEWIVKLIPFCSFSYHRHRRTLSLPHLLNLFWSRNFIQHPSLLLMLFYYLDWILHWNLIYMIKLFLRLHVIYRS